MSHHTRIFAECERDSHQNKNWISTQHDAIAMYIHRVVSNGQTANRSDTHRRAADRELRDKLAAKLSSEPMLHVIQLFSFAKHPKTDASTHISAKCGRSVL